MKFGPSGNLRESTGRLRHLVTVLIDPALVNTIATNVVGEPQPNPQPAYTRWAHIEALTGREFWFANQVTSDVSHRIQMRYVPGLTEKHQIQLGSRIFEIKVVLNPGELQGTTLMDLLCTETHTSGV